MRDTGGNVAQDIVNINRLIEAHNDEIENCVLAMQRLQAAIDHLERVRRELENLRPRTHREQLAKERRQGREA